MPGKNKVTLARDPGSDPGKTERNPTTFSKLHPMRNSGKLVKMADDRIVIVYNYQPLIKQEKIVLNLVDENYKLIKGEDGKPKILVRDIPTFNEEMQAATLIGFVD